MQWMSAFSVMRSSDALFSNDLGDDLLYMSVVYTAEIQYILPAVMFRAYVSE